MPSPHPSIFREYDIRGIVGETLHEEDAYQIARAFAVVALVQGNRVIAVGCDGRVSSPALHAAVCKGLMESGAEVIDVGLGPTPMLYFASCTLKAAGAMMVTGSHNPPSHNGFKFVLNNQAFFGESIQHLRQAIEQKRFVEGKGHERKEDVKRAYLDILRSTYNSARNLSVAWDAGNGATGEVMAELCRRLPGKHVTLNATIDGTFPSHHPDPTEPKNLEQLIATVRSQKLDCGIAFDGDGDRIGVVDDEGEILWGDQLMIIYATDVLHKHPGATVIADVKSSQVLFDWIAKKGGKPLMWKTGHSHIKSKMSQTGALLAGEMSGHMFFADSYFGYDDALYAAVRLLDVLSRSGKRLSDMRKALPKRVNTPEIRFPCPDERKFAVIDEVKARLIAAQSDFNDVDGVRVNTPDGWWLLRASNTQAALTARCEAVDGPALSALTEDLRLQLALSDLALPF